MKSVIETYYNLIKQGKMKLIDIPEKYRERVEVYWAEMEKK